jgi:hypothetical protein
MDHVEGNQGSTDEYRSVKDEKYACVINAKWYRSTIPREPELQICKCLPPCDAEPSSEEIKYSNMETMKREK